MLPPIDWSQPWYAAWRHVGEPVAAAVAAGQPLHLALAAQPGAPLRFVPQGELPPGMPYERYIFESGCCPVREGLHDFFNGLAWLRFPRTKRELNRCQAAELARLGVGPERGAVRDAITVFDENGALLQAPLPLWQALRAREWRRLFVELRPLWREARLLVFGHALLEQLTVPRKGLTAHVWCADAPAGAAGELDAWLCGRMSAQALGAKPFTPLPVLGVPGWWPGNDDFSFYDDRLVFRPPGTRRSRTTPACSGAARP